MVENMFIALYYTSWSHKK